LPLAIPDRVLARALSLFPEQERLSYCVKFLESHLEKMPPGVIWRGRALIPGVLDSLPYWQVCNSFEQNHLLKQCLIKMNGRSVVLHNDELSHCLTRLDGTYGRFDLHTLSKVDLKFQFDHVNGYLQLTIAGGLLSFLNMESNEQKYQQLERWRVVISAHQLTNGQGEPYYRQELRDWRITEYDQGNAAPALCLYFQIDAAKNLMCALKKANLVVTVMPTNTLKAIFDSAPVPVPNPPLVTMGSRRS
jgi:hypothetical protein